MPHRNHASGWSRRRFLAAGGALGATAALTACGAGTSAAPLAGPSRSSSLPRTAPAQTAGELPSGVTAFGPATAPAVLLFHPWWGVSPGVLAWRDTLVDAGARVVIPDLYGGRVTDSLEEAQAWRDALDQTAALEMLDACANALNATGEPWSALGWSLGAFYACLMMSRGEYAPHRAALFYGAAPVSGDSRTEAVQLHIVPDDPYFTGPEIAAALAGFGNAGIAVEQFDYPGMGHWFAEVGSPAFDEAGTGLAIERSLPFLGFPAT